MHANQLMHPRQLVTTWIVHRPPKHQTVITVQEVELATAAAAAPAAAALARAESQHRLLKWPAPHVLPESRSHYYPRRCAYFESSTMSRMMDHL